MVHTNAQRAHWSIVCWWHLLFDLPRSTPEQLAEKHPVIDAILKAKCRKYAGTFKVGTLFEVTSALPHPPTPHPGTTSAGTVCLLSAVRLVALHCWFCAARMQWCI